MYVFIHTFVYIHIHVHIYIQVYAILYIYIYIYIYIKCLFSYSSFVMLRNSRKVKTGVHFLMRFLLTH